MACECANWARDYPFKVLTKHHKDCSKYEEREYVKISLLGTPNQSFIDTVESLGQLVDMMAETSVGDGYCIEKVKMPPEEFEALPEFTGF